MINIESNDYYKLINKVAVPIHTIDEYHEVFDIKNQDNRNVQTDTVNDFYISTTFTGVDSNESQFGAAKVVETLISHTCSELDYIAKTYATWEEAESGHAKYLSRILLLTNTNINLQQLKTLLHDH